MIMNMLMKHNYLSIANEKQATFWMWLIESASFEFVKPQKQYIKQNLEYRCSSIMMTNVKLEVQKNS